MFHLPGGTCILGSTGKGSLGWAAGAFRPGSISSLICKPLRDQLVPLSLSFLNCIMELLMGTYELYNIRGSVTGPRAESLRWLQLRDGRDWWGALPSTPSVPAGECPWPHSPFAACWRLVGTLGLGKGCAAPPSHVSHHH